MKLFDLFDEKGIKIGELREGVNSGDGCLGSIIIAALILILPIYTWVIILRGEISEDTIIITCIVVTILSAIIIQYRYRKTFISLWFFVMIINLIVFSIIIFAVEKEPFNLENVFMVVFLWYSLSTLPAAFFSWVATVIFSNEIKYGDGTLGSQFENSKAGKVSVLFGVFNILISVVIFWAFHSISSGINEDTTNLFKHFSILYIGGQIVLFTKPIGFVIGMAGIFKKNKNKRMAILGILINGLLLIELIARRIGLVNIF